MGEKGFTKAGSRKMIAWPHEELAVYEGSKEAWPDVREGGMWRFRRQRWVRVLRCFSRTT